MLRLKKTLISLLLVSSFVSVFAATAPKAKAQTAETPDAGQCEVISVSFGSAAGLYGVEAANNIEFTDLVKFEALAGAKTIGDIRAKGIPVETANFIQDAGNNVGIKPITVEVVLKNCFGKNLFIDIPGHPQGDHKLVAIGFRDAEHLYFKQAKKAGTTVRLNFNVGEEGCDDGPLGLLLTNNGSYDCLHDANIWVFDGTLSQWKYLTPQNSTKNILAFKCIDNGATIFSERCADNDTDWEFKGCSDGSCILSDEQGNTVTGGGTQFFDPNSPCYDNDKDSPTYLQYREGCNELLAPLPGLAFVDKTIPIGQYVNIIIRVALGILTAAAVVMLILEGVRYMTVGSITGKYDARKKILNIVLGLLVAFGTFTILYTINPNLLNLQPNIDQVSITDGGLQTLSSSQYQGVTGDLIPDDSKVEAAAHKIAAQLNIPYCVYPAIFSTESGGKYGPNTIGHDENVENSNGNTIPAREDFVKSGKKYSGKTFTAGIRTEFNDDNTIKTDQKSLGLDWRFSHGLGATQITFNPKYDAYDPAEKSLYKNSPSLGKVYPKDAMNLETDLTLGGELYKKYLQECGNDTRAAFDAYGDGSCSKRPDNGTGRHAAKKEATYRACIEQFGEGS